MSILTPKEALVILDGLLGIQALTQIQLFVFDRAWAGDSYGVMAETSGYDEDYIKEVGARLWKTISQLLGIKVSKNNLISAFEQYARNARGQANETSFNTPSGRDDVERIDWGEAPAIAAFYGRQTELTQLTKWISTDKCKLVTLLGMGGIGKTTTISKLARQLAASQEFEYIIWRSLRNAPSLEYLLTDLIPFLSSQQETTAEVGMLIQQLRKSRCLVILDNLETILDPARMGQFLAGYEAYGELLELIGTTAHQSCIALTSRERPGVMVAMEGLESPIQILRLQGSSETVAGVVTSRGLKGTTKDLAELGDRYGNNPLAMKIAATSISDLFDGDVRAFLSEEAIAFSGIERLLDQQFQRLSVLEKSVMYWLAINREGTTIAELSGDLVPIVAKGKLIETLESLQGRSLIEQTQIRFTQQPVMMEYVIEQLIEIAIAEICQQSPQLLYTHALLKATASDYIRESQAKLILAPLLSRLESRLGDRSTLIQLFTQHLTRESTPQQTAPIQPTQLHPLGYEAGNYLNFLCQLQADLTGANWTGLTFRQAYLRDTPLSQVNLTNSHPIQCVFADAMNDVYGLAFSPDGTLVAMTSVTGNLCVYQVTTKQWLYSIDAHAAPSIGIAFDLSGDTFFTCSFDSTIRQWDSVNGNCLRSWQTDSSMWEISLSTDGKYLASGHENSTIQIWDLQTLECQQILTGHAGMVTGIDFHPHLPLLVSSSIDGTIKLWDYPTGKCLNTAIGHTNIVWEVKFQPQGTKIGSASNDGSAKLWSLDLECLYTFEVGLILGHPIAFSPNGETFACSCTDAKIRLWDVESGRLLRVLPSGRNLWNITFSPDGRALVSSSDAAQVKFWDVKSGRCKRSLQGELLNFWSIAVNPQGTLIASGGDDARLRLWDLASGKCIQALSGHTSRIAGVVFHPKQPILASGCYDGSIKLWDLQGRCLRTLIEENLARIQTIAFHPNRSLLASGGYDATIRCWDTDTGRSLRTLRLPDGDSFTCTLALHPQGNLLANGNENGFLLLWDIDSGEIIRQLAAHQQRLWTLDFHPQGHQIASGGHDGAVKLWDLETGDCWMELAGLGSKVMSVKFSPDGNLLAIASDLTIQIWDLATQKCIQTLTGHTKLIYTIAFDPNAPLSLVSAGDDGTIRHWNVETGECIQVLRPDRIYEGMNIAGAIGFTEGQRATLKALGALE